MCIATTRKPSPLTASALVVQRELLFSSQGQVCPNTPSSSPLTENDLDAIFPETDYSCKTDDTVTSSLLTVASVDQPAPAAPPKVVRFASDPVRSVIHVPALADISAEERNQTWWSLEDLDSFLRQAQIVGLTVLRGGYGKFLETAFVLPKTNRVGLVQWCKHGHACRGLERWSNLQHRKHRHTARWLAIQAVLEGQKSGADPIKISLIYSRISRAAKHFAQEMGEADEDAIRPSPFLLPTESSDTKVVSSSNSLRCTVTGPCKKRRFLQLVNCGDSIDQGKHIQQIALCSSSFLS